MSDLVLQLTALSGQSEDWLLQVFAVFLRVGAMMALLPGFGEQVIPVRVRLALALAFTTVTFPAVADRLSVVDTPGAFGAEVVAGLILGAGLRLFVHALQIAGTIVAQATSLSQLFGGIDAEPVPTLGTILVVAGLALAMSMGLHVRAAQYILISYDVLPPGLMAGAGDTARWGTAMAAHIFSLAFSLAAPFLIGSLLYNLALGVINRAMPQLMVAMVGAPALTLGTLALFAVLAPLALTIWLSAFSAYLNAPLQAP